MFLLPGGEVSKLWLTWVTCEHLQEPCREFPEIRSESGSPSSLLSQSCTQLSAHTLAVCPPLSTSGRRVGTWLPLLYPLDLWEAHTSLLIQLCPFPSFPNTLSWSDRHKGRSTRPLPQQMRYSQRIYQTFSCNPTQWLLLDPQPILFVSKVKGSTFSPEVLHFLLKCVFWHPPFLLYTLSFKCFRGNTVVVQGGEL